MHSQTYKHGNYTKLMQINFFIAQKFIEIALKYTKKTSKKFDFPMKPKITILLPKCF